MSRATPTFKQQDITRALKGAVNAGLQVQRYEIDKEGKIVVVTVTAPKPEPSDEYQRWKDSRG